LATITGTSGNNSWTIIDPGSFVIDGLGGIDTIDFGTSLRSDYVITQGPNGTVLVDSVSSASGQLHATLSNIELLQFNSRRDTLDLRTFFTDSTPPTVSIGDNVSGTARGNIVFTLSFSEVVTGLAFDDFSLNHGDVLVVSGSGQSYSVTVAPPAGFEGTLSLTLRAAAVQDANANALAQAVVATQAVDTKAPTLLSGSPAAGSQGVSTGTALALVFTEIISRGTGVVRLTDGGTTVLGSFDLARTDQTSISGLSLNLLGASLAAGTGYVVELPAGAVRDLAGNAYVAPADPAVLTFYTAADSSGRVNGTARGDLLAGSAGVDQLNGQAGDDTLRGSEGNDQLDGGDGFDVADYRSGGAQGLVANLATGSVSDPFGASDTLVRIEALLGTPRADSVRGADGVDSQRGDTLRGGAGNDSLDGGSGVDTAEWSGPRADYTVTRLNATTWTVRDNNPANGDEGTDTVTGIERLLFADEQLSFGARAEDIVRVAFVLWSPAIVSSSTLFSRGYSYYDVGYSFEQMSVVALQFWPEQGSAFAQKLVGNAPGTTRTVSELLAVMADAGGGDAGRAAAVRLMALDPATTAQVAASGVLDHGVVSSNFVPDFGTLFQLLPVG
jgi:Ca2+-binding RTX toxin-like protein